MRPLLTLFVAAAVTLWSPASARLSSAGLGGYNLAQTSQYHIQTDEGPERYFRYQTDSGQYRKEKRLEDGTVVGTYGWVDAAGYLRLRDYIADNQGYRIVRTKKLFVGDAPIANAVAAAKHAPSQGGVGVGLGGLSGGLPATTPRPYFPPVVSSTPAVYVSSTSSPSTTPRTVYVTPSRHYYPSSTPAPFYSSTPGYYSSTPSFSTPSYSTPSYSTPSYSTPSYSTPAPFYSSTPVPEVTPSPIRPDEASGYSSPKAPLYIAPTARPPTGYSATSGLYDHPVGVPRRGYISLPVSNALSSPPEYDGVAFTHSGFRYYLPRQYQEEESSPGGDRRAGSFGYIDPFGIRRVIYYNASPGSGFTVRKNNRYVGFEATPYDPRF